MKWYLLNISDKNIIADKDNMEIYIFVHNFSKFPNFLEYTM